MKKKKKKKKKNKKFNDIRISNEDMKYISGIFKYIKNIKSNNLIANKKLISNKPLNIIKKEIKIQAYILINFFLPYLCLYLFY